MSRRRQPAACFQVDSICLSASPEARFPNGSIGLAPLARLVPRRTLCDEPRLEAMMFGVSEEPHGPSPRPHASSCFQYGSCSGVTTITDVPNHFTQFGRSRRRPLRGPRRRRRDDDLVVIVISNDPAGHYLLFISPPVRAWTAPPAARSNSSATLLRASQSMCFDFGTSRVKKHEGPRFQYRKATNYIDELPRHSDLRYRNDRDQARVGSSPSTCSCSKSSSASRRTPTRSACGQGSNNHHLFRRNAAGYCFRLTTTAAIVQTATAPPFMREAAFRCPETPTRSPRPCPWPTTPRPAPHPITLTRRSRRRSQRHRRASSTRVVFHRRRAERLKQPRRPDRMTRPASARSFNQVGPVLRSDCRDVSERAWLRSCSAPLHSRHHSSLQ